jgi:cytochrome bd-type quinol oxidase subunit 2
LSEFGLPDAGGTGDVGYVIMAILEWLLAIVGIVAVIALVVAGIQYFFVATDEKMLERAKKTMTSAIIGLIVALSGVIAIYAVDTMLNAGYLF